MVIPTMVASARLAAASPSTRTASTSMHMASNGRALTPKGRPLAAGGGARAARRWRHEVKATLEYPMTPQEIMYPNPSEVQQYGRQHQGLMDQWQDRSGEPVLAGKLRIFSGTSNPALAKEIAMSLGMNLGARTVKRFADGEVYVQLEESIRGCDVFIVQPTCPPTNDHLMELLVMADACRRASARTITAVIPYFGYARADRRTSGRESIAAKLTANLITRAGVDRVIALDLHSGQCAGYFDIPVDHVAGQVVALDYLTSQSLQPEDMVVVSPDVGGVARARQFAKLLADAPLAIVDKRRQAHNVAKVFNLIGDVEGKVALLVDDMIDTAGTLSAAAALLRERGAREVIACATHAVFSPPAVERLSNGDFSEVIVTDTIPLKEGFPQLTVLSTANLLSEAIWRVHTESSMIKLV